MFTGLGTSDGSLAVFEAKEAIAAGSTNWTFGCRRTYSGAIPTSFQNSDAFGDVGHRVSVFSVKPGHWNDLNTYLPKIETYLNSVPRTHKMRFSVQHEPEDNGVETHTDGEILGTAAQFKTMQRQIRLIVNRVNIRRGSGYPAISFGGTLMAQSAKRKTNNVLWADIYYPGGNTWDFVAWDGYAWWTDNYRTCQAVFDDCVLWSKSKQLNYAISETGVGDSFSPSVRAGWNRDGILWSRKQGFGWWCYWSNDHNELTTSAEWQSLRA